MPSSAPERQVEDAFRSLRCSNRAAIRPNPGRPPFSPGGIVSRPTVGTAFQAAPGVFSWGDVDDDGDHEVVFTSYETNELLVLDYQG